MLSSRFAPLAFAAAATLTLTMAIAPSAQAEVYNNTAGGVVEGIDPFLFPGSDGTFDSTLTIPDSFSINAISGMYVVLFGLRADDAASLSATLTHVDTGTTISLFNNLQSGTALDGAYTFDDAFPLTLDNAPTTTPDSVTFLQPGAYNTADPLSAFFGENGAGDWQLSLLNTSNSSQASFEGWQLGFGVRHFALEGTFGSSIIPEYAGATFKGYVAYPDDAEDLDSTPDKGTYNLSNFLFSITADGATEPFAFLTPDPLLTTTAVMKVGSRTYTITRARVSNRNTFCLPESADINLFFETPNPPPFSDGIDPDPVPLTPPVVDTFVPERSSVILYGSDCGDNPETPEEEGALVPIAEVPTFVPVDLTAPPPRSTPEPASVLGLGLLGGLGWLTRKRRSH
ncbi:MAG TPA: PEP-CTERM sorting domain-containing protein [Chroococcidiopsis sp.]